MGFLNFVRTSILRMDLLSTTPSFRARQQPNYQTFFGGIFSFLLMIGFGYVLFYQFQDMLNYQQIIYTQGLTDNVGSDASITSIQMAVAIEGVDLTANTKKFIYLLTHIKVSPVNGVVTTVRNNIILRPCNISDWQNIGSNFKQQYTAFRFDRMLCIQSGQDYKLSGYVGSTEYNYLNFQITACDQSKDSSCDTPTNISNYMNNYLTTNDYFKVRFFLVDTILTPSNDIPISYVLQKNIFMSFTKTIGTVGYINLADFTLETDDNYLPLTTTTSQTGSYIDGFQTNSVSISSTKYVSIGIYKSTKSTTVSRTIGKIDTVLSYVGGLFGLIFTGITFMIGSYSQMKYELYVAESILKVDQSNKRIGQSDFGFTTYIFYCCYDWLDTFGIAPKCLKWLSTIHQVREEACNQLDPTIILKRIKYLEDVSKVLLSEHRELSLYLTQPLSLQQARRMRNTLTYYDRVLSDIKECNQSQNSVGDEKYQNNFNKDTIYIDNMDDCNKIKQNLTEQQQQQMLQKLLIQAMNQLNRDHSELGMRIKSKMGKNARQWLKNKNINKQKINKVNQQNIISIKYPQIQDGNETSNNLKISKYQRISLKRQKR